MNSIKTFLLFALGILLITNASAVMNAPPLGDFQDGSHSATITYGNSINFNVDFSTSGIIRAPMTISIKMYNSADTVIQTFDVSSYNGGTSFQKTYTITSSIYSTTGTFEIILNGRDNSGSSTSDSLILTVNSIPTPTNNAPVITSTAVTSVNENTAYTYDVDATDADGDTVTYSLTQNPAWLSINSNTGLISGTAPLVDSDTNYAITVRASDGTDYAEQSYTLTVKNIPTPTPTNNAPVITILGTNPITITQGTTYTDAGATATDVEDGSLTSLIIITGTVNTNIVGTYVITYSVTDSNSNTATATRTVNVSAAPVPIVVIISPTDGTTYDNKITSLQVQITSANLQSTWFKKNGGSSIYFTATSGEIKTISTNSIVGTNTWIVYARDTFGNIVSATISFIVNSPHNGGGSGGNEGNGQTITAPAETPVSTGQSGAIITPTTAKKTGGFSVVTFLYMIIATISLGIVVVSVLLFKRIKGIKY